MSSEDSMAYRHGFGAGQLGCAPVKTIAVSRYRIDLRHHACQSEDPLARQYKTGKAPISSREMALAGGYDSSHEEEGKDEREKCLERRRSMRAKKNEKKSCTWHAQDGCLKKRLRHEHSVSLAEFDRIQAPSSDGHLEGCWGICIIQALTN